MNELDKLRPEVREAMEVMDRLNTVTGSWNLLRAELTRLADENAQLREQTKAPAVVWKQRAESAEAELAAVKARFAEAPRVKDPPGTWDTIERLRSVGYVDGMAIALLPVDA